MAGDRPRYRDPHLMWQWIYGLGLTVIGGLALWGICQWAWRSTPDLADWATTEAAIRARVAVGSASILALAVLLIVLATFLPMPLGVMDGAIGVACCAVVVLGGVGFNLFSFGSR